MQKDEITAALRDAGTRAAEELDIAHLAMLMALYRTPDLQLTVYEDHLRDLCFLTRARHEDLRNAGAEDDVKTQLAALKHVIVDQHGYVGDTEDYDNIANADLLAVIERRRGMPVALGVLYLHVAEECGWDIAGINFPSHFLLRLEKDGQRLIFDPFDTARPMEAAHLRALLKKNIGENAELSAHYYDAVDKRTVILRLQNNIKLRQVEAADYESALLTTELMRLIAPDEFRLLFDYGVLAFKCDMPQKAFDALQDYAGRTPDARARAEALVLMEEIKRSIH
ncbi:MAG: hypothetical protein GC136_00365 [Alphaproteobacteria bacterium]|nr:hypothetical protein [Alphaproteobacteria bacterium]